MTTLRQNPDGSWSDAEPLPLTNDLDIEVYGTGPWVWQAWTGLDIVARGRAWTRPGLRFALWRTQRRHARRARR